MNEHFALLFEISSFLFFLIIGSWNMRGIFTFVQNNYLTTLARMVQTGQLTDSVASKKIRFAAHTLNAIWIFLTVYWAIVLVVRIWYR